MNRLFLTAFLSLFVFSLNAFSQTFFQKIAGNWEGTLEYLDYKENKRVKLKTYLTVTVTKEGNSAELLIVYDDFGKIIKDTKRVKIDAPARKYTTGDTEYVIETIAENRIVLLGSGQDGERIEPIRQTISFDDDSLVFLQETRTPWQFRNQMTFKRAAESILAARILSSGQLREDFDVLKKALTAVHPGIYRYQTPLSLETIFQEFEAKLSKPLTESDFFLLVAQIANRVRCGHTYPNPYNQNPLLRERIAGNKTYLPFYFAIVDERIIVTHNASPQNLARGSEITKINGIPAKTIVEKLMSVTNADGVNTFAHRVQSIELNRFQAERYALFDWYFPLFFPLENEVLTIEAVDYATKKKTKFQTSAMTKTERTAEITKRYGKTPDYDDGWTFEIQANSTGYLKIENSITWRLKTVNFKEFIKTAFAELKAKNIKNLIVDLRGNDGGDTNVGFELTRFLAKKNLPPYIASRRLVRNVAPQIDLAKYLDTYSDELKVSLQNGLPQNLYKKAENDFYEILPNSTITAYPPVAPEENNFQGKTFFISDASNASATFQFLNYVKENELGVIVGQRTGGNRQGINGGNYFFLRLPHSKIEIDLPVYFFAPLKTQKDESVVPDVEVRRRRQDIGADYDRELAVIKKLIAKD